MNGCPANAPQPNPSATIKLVLEAVCVLLDVKPAKVRCNIAPC